MANPTNTMNDNTPLVIQNYGHPPANQTIQGSQGTLAVGSVLAIDTDDDKLALVDDSDGTIDEPEFVLLKEVDTSSGDVTAYPAMLLMAGIVNSDKLVFGGDDTISDHFVALKGAGIVAVNPANAENYDNT